MSNDLGVLSAKFANEHTHRRLREMEDRLTEWKLFSAIMAAGMTFFFIAFVIVLTEVK